MADMDMPPASDDPAVQQYVETQWREAMRAGRECMQAIRRIYPEMTDHLPETGTNHIIRALEGATSITLHLHKSGKFVLGQDAYDEYIDAQTRRRMASHD